MPTRPRTQAPVDRVYSAETPAHQTTFKPQKQRIRSYGKQNSTRKAKQDTLTQMDWVKLYMANVEDEDMDSSTPEAVDRPRKRRKTRGDEQQSSSNHYQQTLTQFERSFTSTGENDDIVDIPVNNPDYAVDQEKSTNMQPPPTPQRVIKLEIPSSQSPATPPSFSLRSTGKTRSMLGEGSIDTPIPFKLTRNTNVNSSPRRIPKLEVKDTFDSEQASNPPSSASKRTSPAKSVRFALSSTMRTSPSPAIKRESDVPLQSEVSGLGTPSRNLNVKTEILDSDADSDDDGSIVDGETDERTHQPSCYDELGPETQLETDRLLTLPESNGTTTGSEQEARQEVNEDISEENTTQGLESQRLSTQFVDCMAPRTMKSDIIISIHPQHVTNIVNRSKDHEFRSWPIPQGVSRLWIYETRPTSELRYMAVISEAKTPGEITDLRGLGNASFNAQSGGLMRYAYEILELYELADPLSLTKLREKEWISSPPQKYAFVRPAVLDQLIANLKPPLFVSTPASQDNPSSPLTISQEAEAQLLSDVREQTNWQSASSPYRQPHLTSAPVTPTKPLSSYPSQATTVDLTPSQPVPSSPFRGEIVHDSPIRECPSSTPIQLPPLRRDAEEHDETPAESELESLVPFSIASSQLLTKSQMLPESLLNDSVPEPPPVIADSEDED